MITISACMIVKNEQEVLARCLDSLSGIYDELIIIDTGSTDLTKEIAKKYTDHVYDFEWVNDFSKARNVSFSKATKDYIYVADADEVIDEDNRREFLKLKQVLLPEIEIVQMKYGNQLEFNTTYNYDLEYRPKLYKRQRTFTWIDPIHESVRLDPVIYDSEIIINHMPLSNHAPRDFQVFQSVIARGEPLSKKLKSMYARELYISGTQKDFVMAKPYFMEQSQREDVSLEELRYLYTVLIRCARMQEDLRTLFSYCTKALAGNIATSEICFEMGEYYYEKKEYQEAVLWFHNAVYETESELNVHYQGDYPLLRLADCYHQLGQIQQMKQYQRMAQEWNV